MLVGGALGNLIDRIANGAVTDFIKLPALAGVQRRRHVDHVRRAGAAVGARGPPRQSGERRARASSCACPDAAAGTRLDRFLADPLGSRARAQSLIDAGRVRVDGALVPKRHLVRPARRSRSTTCAEAGVRRWTPATRREFGDRRTRTSTCWWSTSRPAWSCIPARGHWAGTLAQALEGRAAGGEEPWRAGIVHRLDRDTSGLLVVAKNDEVHRALKSLLARRAAPPRVPRARRRPPAGADRDDRRADRAPPARPEADVDRQRRPARGAHPLRDRAAAAGDRAAARHARDRPHPPDPRPPGGDRPSGVRRPPVRGRAAGSAWSASSCTPRGWRSSTRSPASRSTSRRRCRTTWWRRWRWRRREE